MHPIRKRTERWAGSKQWENEVKEMMLKRECAEKFAERRNIGGMQSRLSKLAIVKIVARVRTTKMQQNNPEKDEAKSECDCCRQRKKCNTKHKTG